MKNDSLEALCFVAIIAVSIAITICVFIKTMGHLEELKIIHKTFETIGKEK